MFEEYGEVLVDELGLSVEGLWEHFFGSHASAIRGVHIEHDHAMHNIRLALCLRIVPLTKPSFS